jgi:hypothetical protein
LGGVGYPAAPGFNQQPQVSPTQPGMGGLNSTNTTTQADMMGGMGGGMPPMQGTQGGKSSGLGEAGYPAAPGFGGSPTNPFLGMPISSVNSTTQADMMGGNRDGGMPPMQALQGGKSSGLGGLGYQAAPGFGGSLSGLTPQQRGVSLASPEMERIRFQNAINNPTNQPDPVKLQALQQDPRLMQMQQAQVQPMQQQMMGAIQPTFTSSPGMPFGGVGGRPFASQQTPEGYQAMQDYYAQDRINQANRGRPPMQQQPMQQPMQQFQQAQVQPMQQPQNISGLQGLMDKMRGQQKPIQQPRQMPKFQSKALQFKPNTQNAQAALSRVKPSVQKQNQDAQAARIAELEAQIAAQQQSYNPYDYGGGG